MVMYIIIGITLSVLIFVYIFIIPDTEKNWYEENKKKWTEEDLYLVVTDTLSSRETRHEGLWQKCLILCEGNTEQAKYMYINKRVKQLAEKYGVVLSKETKEFTQRINQEKTSENNKMTPRHDAKIWKNSEPEFETVKNFSQNATHKIHTIFINILRVISFLPLLGLLQLIISSGVFIFLMSLSVLDSETTTSFLTKYAKIFDIMLFLIALYVTYKYVISQKRTIIGLIIFIIISTLLYVALPFGFLAMNDSFKQSNLTGNNSEYWEKFYRDADEEKAKLDKLCGDDMDCRLYHFNLETERKKVER